MASEMTTAAVVADPAEAVRLDAVCKVYGTAENPVTALDGVSLTVRPGTFTAVMGPSGSGKSTLLQLAAGLDEPTDGKVFVAGTPMSGDETQLTKLRRERVGFVFQQFNLLPVLSVLQNVLLPLRLAGRTVDVDAAKEILERVGLSDRLEHRPAELSGGQQQRVAIARALVTNPTAIFADEPTGALDSKSAGDVLALLQEAVRSLGQTVVMVTHDPIAAAHADAVLFLTDGRIVGQLEHPSAETVADRMTHLSGGSGSQLSAVGVE
jgi:putative ABC transport system ATP-binding protein